MVFLLPTWESETSFYMLLWLNPILGRVCRQNALQFPPLFRDACDVRSFAQNNGSAFEFILQDQAVAALCGDHEAGDILAMFMAAGNLLLAIWFGIYTFDDHAVLPYGVHSLCGFRPGTIAITAVRNTLDLVMDMHGYVDGVTGELHFMKGVVEHRCLTGDGVLDPDSLQVIFPFILHVGVPLASRKNREHTQAEAQVCYPWKICAFRSIH